ncbi:MAG TPA: hypothetical protein PKI41_14870 [Candidatus Competibacteraceae bacterium]|nr:hypothetical protein [Candidatus Competibacteraceae bacterium]HQA26614.1 hypothetical protein [Candidatus Competibacteraceae bacterium]HQD56492.1 hypothetical protein [Candidatus Competibacteraceae bacterium]
MTENPNNTMPPQQPDPQQAGPQGQGPQYHGGYQQQGGYGHPPAPGYGPPPWAQQGQHQCGQPSPYQGGGYGHPPAPGYGPPPWAQQGGHPGGQGHGYYPPSAYGAPPPGYQAPASYGSHPHAYVPHHHHESGLASFFNFRDERFVKGAITGAAVTFLLTNDTVQKNAIKSLVKIWNMFQGGFEEVKERFKDAEAEIKTEGQGK